MPSCYYLFKVYSQSAKSRCIESGRLVLLSSEAREPPFSGIHYKAKLQSHSSRIGKDTGIKQNIFRLKRVSKNREKTPDTVNYR